MSNKLGLVIPNHLKVKTKQFIAQDVKPIIAAINNGEVSAVTEKLGIAKILKKMHILEVVCP